MSIRWVLNCFNLKKEATFRSFETISWRGFLGDTDKDLLRPSAHRSFAGHHAFSTHLVQQLALVSHGPQQAPSRASVYGIINRTALAPRSTAALPEVEVTVASALGAVKYAVRADVSSTACELLHWRAFLPPTASGPEEYSIRAALLGSENKGASSVLDHVIFGDVWFCGGQSNMLHPVSASLSRAEALEKARSRRAIGNIRFLGGEPDAVTKPRAWASANDANGTGGLGGEPALFQA